MQVDRSIALIAGWVAGPAFGVAMIAAPDYLKLRPVLVPYLLWGGILVFVTTPAVVVILSMQELKDAREPVWPILFMSLGALLFLIGLSWHFWPSSARDLSLSRQDATQSAISAHNSKPDKVTPDESGPPLGSLRFVAANLIIEKRKSTNQIAAQVEVELHNDTNHLVDYHSITAGNVNGVAFAEAKVEFDGYIYPNQSAKLFSRRVADFPISEPREIAQPSVKAIYEYEIRYKFATSSQFIRKTSRGLNLTYWPPLPKQNPGESTKIPITVMYYNELEE